MTSTKNQIELFIGEAKIAAEINGSSVVGWLRRRKANEKVGELN